MFVTISLKAETVGRDPSVCPEQHVCGDFIYLAPEVLKGDLYISCADVYAFGLLIFELLVGIISFSNQRKMSLDLFVQNVNSYKMMNFEESLSLLDDSVKYLIIALGRQVSLLVGGDNHLLTVRSNWRQSNKIYNNTHYNILFKAHLVNI
jgi:hypothetical protein